MTPSRNILFISANKIQDPYPVYPLGIAYLLTYLKMRYENYNFEVLDMNLDSEDELIHSLKKFKPDYICISIRNIDGADYYDPVHFIDGYKKIVDRSREHSSATIVIGGAGFSIFPEPVFKTIKPDFAVKGEGEESLYKLINALEQKQSYTGIEGLIYRDADKVIMNERKHYFNDLSLSFDNRLLGYYWQNSGMLNIQTKRGCPLKCIYCTYPVIEGKKVRYLNPDKIIRSIQEIKISQKIDYLFFTDSVFNLDKKYTTELAKKIIKSNLQIRWGGYFFPKDLDKEYLKILKESGLTHIEFGTESLCDKTLKNYGKHFTVKDVFKVSENCHQLDIYHAHFLILAGYGEDDKTINETFENSRKIDLTVYFPHVGMRIYPGTRLHNFAIKDGIIDSTDDLITPKFYISKKVTIDNLQERAKATGKRWVFTDEDTKAITDRLRQRGKKGPMWEYLMQ